MSVQARTRRIVTVGVLSAISILLGITRIGFIPWLAGASLTIMHVPVVIGAVLEGPVAGAIIGLIFGIASLLQAAIAPNGPADILFTNPLISVLPRLFIGPVAWLVWKALKRWTVPGLLITGIAGSLTNSVLVLGMIGLLGQASWALIASVFVANSLAEAAASAILTLAVVAAWWRLDVGKKGSDL